MKVYFNFYNIYLINKYYIIILLIISKKKKKKNTFADVNSYISIIKKDVFN